MSQDDPSPEPAARNGPGGGWAGLTDRLVRLARPGGTEPGFVNPPVSRGSTVLFPTLRALRQNGAKRYAHELTYGACGTPTQFHLERAIAEIEGGTHSQIVSSGSSACTTPLLAFLGAGGHCLMPDCVYGPTRRFCDTMLQRMGVETTYYEPRLPEAALHALMRPNTQVVWAESPGSHTFEVQDVPMLARVAHEHGAKLILDNTWGLHVFQPFEHGVDVSIQALTKYAGGHADLILGAITVFIIDREFDKASAFALAGSILTFFGFIQGSAIGVDQTPEVAFAYLAVAAILFVCFKYATFHPHPVELHAHGEREEKLA